jgi:two-component system nitrogen regulation sensor histidine kinase GlnL
MGTPERSDYRTGLDALVTAVLILDRTLHIRYANPAAENLFAVSSTAMIERTLDEVFVRDAAMHAAIESARANGASYTEHEVRLGALGRDESHDVCCSVTPVDDWFDGALLVELRPTAQQRRVEREERMVDQTRASRELLRNLAHEIRNPLGGIRGAAQLLEAELGRPELSEYTRVIMTEADRLRSLLDRMLSPHRRLEPASINVHEPLERARSLILAEFPSGLRIRRDYDTSLPPITGDRQQIVQALLNIVRNAAQALAALPAEERGARGEITLRTRFARQVTIARRRHPRAIEIRIIDDGPGIAPEISERIFYPLVSAREGGTGLGLTLAQTFIGAHHGSIEFESRPGHTCFTVMLPILDRLEAGPAGLAPPATGGDRPPREPS